MKIYKKLGLSIIFIFFVIVGLGAPAYAANRPQNFQTDPSAMFNTDFVYKNGQILVTITDTLSSGEPSYDLTFTQNSKNKLEYDSTQQLFCQSNVQIVAAPAKITLSKAPTGGTLQGDLSVYAWVQAGSACKHYSSTKTIENQDPSKGGNTGRPVTLSYNSDTYTQVGNSTLYGINKVKGTDCYGGSIIVADSSVSNGTAYLGLDYTPDAQTGSLSPLSAQMQKDGLATSKLVTLTLGCGFSPTVSPQGYSGTITNGKLNAKTPTPPEPAAAKDDTSACVANSHTSLEWLLCPVTTSISKGVDAMDALITSQLNFDVKGNLSDKAEIHTAWSIIKNIATILIILLMLVMVFSQAIGGQLFDAYTIRKLLPRLVIAVIAMQLSWEICKYLITLANDAGQSIAQILTAPFGTGGNVDLNSILHRLNPGWSLASQAIIPALLVSAEILAFVSLGGSLVIVFGLFVGVIMALMMLLFRNVLIVALVMFSPVAFLLWTLPGQGMQKYWKLWSDNFTKLLMLFPLVIALIYSGRIFAWVIAGTNHRATGDGLPLVTNAGFIDYITILVAYFAPYFIVFKAYKWGGSLYSAAGGAVAKGRQGIIKANSGWLNTMGERAQANLADKYKVRTSTEREIQDRINKRKAQGKSTDRLDELLKKTQQRPFSGKRKFGVLPIPNREWMKNYGYRIGAGTPLPTERQKVETLAKAGTYKKDLVDKKQALMHTDFVEELSRNGGNVGGAKEFIRNRYGLDNYERDAQGTVITNSQGDPVVKDKYTDRAFMNWMVDTNSWKELGDEDWRMGAINGKIDKQHFMPGGKYESMNRAIAQGRSLPVIDRVASTLAAKDHIVGYQTDPTLTTDDILLKGKKPKLDIAKTTGFMGMMNSDPNRYRAVSEKFPLFQPFNQALGGGPKPEDYAPSLVDVAGTVLQPGGKNASPSSTISVADYLNHPANPTHDPTTAKELAQIERENRGSLEAEDARLSKWLTNMEHTSDIGSVRAEHYNMMRDVEAQLAVRGLKMKSSTTLETMLTEMANSSSMEGRSVVQRLMGGEKSARAAINDMYGNGYLEALLNVDIQTPTIRASAAGKRLAVLPGERAIGNEPQLREFIQKLLVNPNWDPKSSGSNPLALELMQTIGEIEGYSKDAHGIDREKYIEVIDRLYDSVGRSREGVTAVNQFVHNIINYRKWRVRRVYNDAMSQGKTPDEAVAIAEKALEVVEGPIGAGGKRSGGEIGLLQGMIRPIPTDDPTVLQVHTPPPINPLR